MFVDIYQNIVRFLIFLLTINELKRHTIIKLLLEL